MTSTHTGFKFVQKDGTTRGDYRWPIVTIGSPVRVESTNPTEHDDPCPKHEGDGLCVALSVSGASSGGVSATEAVGLWLGWEDTDVLAKDVDKLRVRGVTVTGSFDPLRLIREGRHIEFVPILSGAKLSWAKLRGADLSWADLSWADLSWAGLTWADLSWADLRWADLTWADLSPADLRWADLRRADLSGADLSGANLRGADLSGANLSGANLRGANLSGANLTRAIGDQDWEDLISRGAIRNETAS